MWKKLTHPNILPLLGITISPSHQLISAFISGGDLLDYLGKYPNADRLKLVDVPSLVFVPPSPTPLVIRPRRGPLLPTLLQCDSRGSQGGT